MLRIPTLSGFALAGLLGVLASCSGGDGASTEDFATSEDDASPPSPDAAPPMDAAGLSPADAPRLSPADTLPGADTFLPLDALPSAPDTAPANAKLRIPQHPLSCDRPLTLNPESTQLLRLTNLQYVNTLRDLFAGQVEQVHLPKLEEFPPQALGSTFSNNAAHLQDSQPALAVREAAALKVAEAAVADLPRLMGCEATTSAAEPSCVESFLDRFALRAWRRPLTTSEKQDLTALFTAARTEFGFAESISTLVGAILQAPQFLFRVQQGVGEVGADKSRRLSGYEVAANLSYALWNSMPDEKLLKAAEDGFLLLPEELEKHARRMLEDHRARDTLAVFHREWLRLTRIAADGKAASKDATQFPAYNETAAAALSSGLHAFVADAFWSGDHSLKRLLISPTGFVNDASAPFFGVPAPGSMTLMAVALPPEQRKGLLTQAAVMSALAGTRMPSPSRRGAYVMQALLCSPLSTHTSAVVLPDAQPNTPFRQTFTQAVAAENCQSCHRALDGIGFLFGNYDAVGRFQAQAGNTPIDASSTVVATYDIDGAYTNALSFADALARSEQVAQCAVQNFFEFALARYRVPEDGCFIEPLTNAFIAKQTDMQELIVELVKSTAFRFRSAATP